MVGKKQATRKNKAAAGGANAVDGVPTELAAKKKHVRDLAKARRWQEIKKLYGEKMVAKAKAFAEKNKAKHTPQSLAQEILAKNGYTSPSPVKNIDKKQLRMKTPDAVAPIVIEVSPDTLTEAQKQQIEKRRREALERRNRKLTKLAAPEKPVTKPVCSIDQRDVDGRYPQATPNGFVKQRQQVQAQETGTKNISYDAQQQPANRKNNSHQVAMIPNNYFVQTDQQNRSSCTPQHESIKQSEVALLKNQPSLFLDELDAAADIVNWEKEQLASEDPVLVHEISPDEYTAAASISKWASQHSKTSTVANERFPISEELAAAADIARWEEEQKQQVAISNELAAVMEIVQWEKEQASRDAFEKDQRTLSDDIAAAADVANWELDHQNDFDEGSKFAVSDVIPDDDDPEFDRPHFQLLGTTPLVSKPSHGSVVTPVRTTSTTKQPGCPQPNPQQTSNPSSHKRKNEPAKEYLEKQQATNPRNIARSPSTAHTKVHQSPQVSVDQNRQAVDAFM